MHEPVRQDFAKLAHSPASELKRRKLRSLHFTSLPTTNNYHCTQCRRLCRGSATIGSSTNCMPLHWT